MASVRHLRLACAGEAGASPYGASVAPATVQRGRADLIPGYANAVLEVIAEVGAGPWFTPVASARVKNSSASLILYDGRCRPHTESPSRSRRTRRLPRRPLRRG